MNWLLQNRSDDMHKLIKAAVKDGLAHELEHITQQDHARINEHLHTMVLDFLTFFEKTLIEQLDERDAVAQKNEKAVPALKKIDHSKIDVSTIRDSLQEIQTLVKNYNKETSCYNNDEQEKVFENILKNWQPQQEEDVN